MCDLHINHSHKSNNTNKSNVLTPKQRLLLKPPTEEVDFSIKSPHLSTILSPSPHGVYNDRCVTKNRNMLSSFVTNEAHCVMQWCNLARPADLKILKMVYVG